MKKSIDIPDIGKYSKAKAITSFIAFVGVMLSISAGLFIAGAANISQIILIYFSLIAFLIAFARIELGVVAMIIVVYSQLYIIVGERYGITDLAQGLIMLTGLAMLTRWIVYKAEIYNGWMQPMFLIFFYALVGLATVPFAENQALAMPVAVETIKSGIIAFMIAILLGKFQSLRLSIWGLLSIGLILGFLSVFQFATNSYDNDYGGFAQASVENIVGEDNGIRVGGPFGDPNYFAQIMLVLIPLGLDRLWTEKKTILRILAGLAVFISAFTVILTYSRGGFLAMMILIAAMIFIFQRDQMRYFVAILVLGFVLMNFLPSRFTERIKTLTELVPSVSYQEGYSYSDYSFRGRTSEMIVAVQMFTDHPVLGVGLGNYPVLYQEYSQRLGIELRAEQRQAHSLYLEVASETGVIGLLGFGLLLWMAIKSMWKAQASLARVFLFDRANMVIAFTLGFIGYLLAALFIHSAYPRNFWLLAGIALSIPRMAKNEIDLYRKRYSVSSVK